MLLTSFCDVLCLLGEAAEHMSFLRITLGGEFQKTTLTRRGRYLIKCQRMSKVGGYMVRTMSTLTTIQIYLQIFVNFLLFLCFLFVCNRIDTILCLDGLHTRELLSALSLIHNALDYIICKKVLRNKYSVNVAFTCLFVLPKSEIYKL